MSAQSGWGLVEKPLDALEKVPEDPSWIKWLPAGSKIIGTDSSGASSFWSRTARIDTELPDGQLKSYFFKLMTGERGYLMARGEYQSMAALYNTAPACIPRPVGWGTYENDPESHFFICDFLDLADEIPDPVSVCEALADLHHKSVGQSKNGMFGFDVETCNGNFPQDNRWNVSWEAFFIQQMEGALRADEEVHGHCQEYEQLRDDFFNKVIPRLLRPLETGNNDIKPCLIHGDLWDGNTSCRVDTDQPYFYDASSFWGHNEYDLHNWRGARFRLSKSFIKEYFNHFPISPPQEDWDDRNMLYAIRADLHSSILHFTTTRFRQLVIAAMADLVQKFPAGYEGKEKRKGAELVDDTDSIPKVDSGDVASHEALVNDSRFGAEDEQIWAQQNPSEAQSVSKQDAILGPVVHTAHFGTDDDVSEVHFGESAISPRAGSVVGGHL